MSEEPTEAQCPTCGIRCERTSCPVCGRATVPVLVPDGDVPWELEGVAEEQAALPTAEEAEAEQRAAWQPTNPYAVVGLTLALLGGSVLAIIFGRVALGQIDRYGKEGGRSVAQTAVVLGSLEVAFVLVVLLVRAASG